MTVGYWGVKNAAFACPMTCDCSLWVAACGRYYSFAGVTSEWGDELATMLQPRSNLLLNLIFFFQILIARFGAFYAMSVCLLLLATLCI